MNILFVSAWYPFPANNGSRIRIYNLLRRLAGIARVYLLVFADQYPETSPPELAEICERIQVVPRRLFDPGSLRSLLGYFNRKPRSIIDTYDPQAAEAIAGLRASVEFDLAIASQWQSAMYADALEGIPAIFEEVELGIFQDPPGGAGKFNSAFSGRLRRTKLKYYLRSLFASFAAVTVASTEEARLVAGALPEHKRIFVIPNAVSLTDYPATSPAPAISPAPVPGRMIFNGAMTYEPNAQAMHWFLQNVFPVVREQRPGVELLITGSTGGAALPEAEGVTLTGYLDDIRPAIASACLAVAPILRGGGTRLKILEALAIGTPVVTTSKGVEGLELEHEKHVLIADTAGEFAQSVVRLLDSSALRKSLVLEGRRRIAEKYDWDVVFPQFEAVIRSVMAREKQT